MDQKYIDFKKEIEKINQRIKEYLWKKQNLFQIRQSQQSDARNWFLAGQSKLKKSY